MDSISGMGMGLGAQGSTEPKKRRKAIEIVSDIAVFSTSACSRGSALKQPFHPELQVEIDKLNAAIANRASPCFDGVVILTVVYRGLVRQGQVSSEPQASTLAGCAQGYPCGRVRRQLLQPDAADIPLQQIHDAGMPFVIAKLSLANTSLRN